MDKESVLIQIKKGTPDWDKPLMSNLYLLEKKINEFEGIDFDDIKSLQQKIWRLSNDLSQHIDESSEEFKKIQKIIDKLDVQELEDIKNNFPLLKEKIYECQEDIQNIKAELDIVKNNYDDINLKILKMTDSFIQINNEFIKIKEAVISTEENIEFFAKEINQNKEFIANLNKQTQKHSESINILNDKNTVIEEKLNLNSSEINLSKENIEKNTTEINLLNNKIEHINEKIEELSFDKANFHFIVNEIKDLPSIESQKIENGSLCYVRNQNKLFIFDNLWKELSTGGTSGSVLWENILNKPKSTVKDIDLSVVAMHTHTNKETLDSISFKKISDWDNKPLKEDIPTKISQLENDKKYITLDDVPVFDDSGIKTSITELENNKANKNHTHNGKDIMFDENKNIIDKISDIELNISSIPSQEYLDSKLEDKANKKDIPTKTSQLNNDNGYITMEDVPVIDLSEIESNLDNLNATKANKGDIPTKITDLENNAGFINDEKLSEEISKLVLSIDKIDKNKVDEIDFEALKEVVDTLTGGGEGVDLTEFANRLKIVEQNKLNKKDLLTSVQELKIDLGYLTSEDIVKDSTITNINDTILNIKELLNGKAEKIDIPTKLSSLENDKNFITLDDIVEYDDTDLKSNIKELQENKANRIHKHTTEDIVVGEDSNLTLKLNKLDSNIANKIDSKDVESKLSLKADKEAIPTKISELENDKSFITPETLKTNPDITKIKSNLSDKINKSEKGKASGVVPLDKNSQISLEYLPDISKQQVYIVNTKEEMDELSNLIAGDRAYILDSGDAYIWNGEEWKVVSKAEWANVKLDWTHIENNPISEVDLSNIKTISEKANKTEIPTKISQLTDDTTFKEDISNLNKNKVDKEVGKSLSTNDYTDKDKELVSTISTKAEKTHSHKIEDIELLSEKLLEINNSILNKAEKSFVEEQIKEVKTLVNNIDIPEVDLSGINKQLADLTLNKADKDALELIQKTINLNKELWEKDTIYDDTEVKDLIDLKADKKSLDSGLSKKVDKVDGKTLSTNDYSDLDKIEVGKVKDKADKSALALKADKSAVDKISTDIADNRAKWEKDTIYDDTTIKNTITKKADTAYVDTELSKKVNVVDGKGLSTNDYTTADKNEVTKIKDKADKSALNAIETQFASALNVIVTQIADNKELWEKDTIYDDTSIKTELEKKADKSELLSIFTQENEPKEMKSGDQWHQIIE